MKKYKIEVWYRYVSHGQQEKEFDTHEVEAETEIEAIKIVKSMYKIPPFKITIKQ